MEIRVGERESWGGGDMQRKGEMGMEWKEREENGDGEGDGDRDREK